MITLTPHSSAGSDSSDTAPALVERSTRVARAAAVLRELWAGLRRFHAEQIELQERLLLLNHPKREDVRRCSHTDGEDQLEVSTPTVRYP